MTRFFPNSFNISSFISEIGKSSYVRSDRYEIFFTNTRNGEQVFTRQDQEKMNLRLESVSLPGSGIASEAVKLQAIDREMPYGVIYEGDITLEFFDDENLSIRGLFKKWQDRVVDQVTYQLNYYDSYICNMGINLFNEVGEEITCSYTVQDVFPKSINAIDLSTSGDTLVKTQVVLSYRKWIDTIS